MELSARMQAAIDHMRRHDNKLVRYPGGYWAAEGWSMYRGLCFGTPTVEALVRRGVARYTIWVDGRSGKFPVECSLIETQKVVEKSSQDMLPMFDQKGE